MVKGEDVQFCDLVHLVKTCYNTLKEVRLPSDMDNTHMHSVIEQKMCPNDRKVWARDLEMGKKPATLHVLHCTATLHDCGNEIANARHSSDQSGHTW